MDRFNLVGLCLCLCLCLIEVNNAQLKQNYYALTCPGVEYIVRRAVQAKITETFVTVPATLRLFFHDCFVEGCDASVMIASSSGTAEKDHSDNLSLAGDGFDTVIKAKAAVDAVPCCRNKVSCADILAMATRDVVYLSGGPDYPVELGRLDGLSSTASSVTGKLPKPDFDLDQLNTIFSANGLSQLDMIALSAAHTLGFSHCSMIANRIYGNPVDPTLNSTYVTELRSACPEDVDPRVAINMDPTSPTRFDNDYFKNLQQGKGLFKSDQVLFTDSRSNGTVNTWAQNSEAFYRAFAVAMGKLGRVGVKTRISGNGNIRSDCTAFN